MALFQHSVLNQYLQDINPEEVTKAWGLYKLYFHNLNIQENILAQKEEQFQEGFLRELFVKILGYTINPEPNFNLTTELKNIKGSKKVDGAIIDNITVLAVIELKGTNVTDLSKVEEQAFNYKSNQVGCRYVVISNFQKLRFYIDNAIEFEEWDLFKLNFEGFKTLFLCLSKKSIFVHLPAAIKQQSIIVEENVTKKLYNEYSFFRKTLFNNIVSLNKSIDKLLLFKKTQKLLDRFLFLFFAEDRMLVPPNSVRMILKQWVTLKDMDAYQPLYERFRKYFVYLNIGHKGKLHEIFAYNGGLFANDEMLDTIKIDDEILYDASLSLSRYDYNSDVDVNILGHIFEHSLTEIEELENEIANNTTSDNKTTKRKKDGVFYTPKYITKYIVENTIGTLCKNKKEQLVLEETDYHKLTKKEKKKLFATLEQYRTWLLQITVIDPACGSGAFLNQALEFLIAEHKWISELEANITGSIIVFDVENSILENNLFGVDINEESVEIAKLSLWLRTARKGRKLNSLNNNIKCGNSLIDDANIVGDKAFNWEKEFPQVFTKGGFDVVIGNPPYVSHDRIEYKLKLKEIYKCYSAFTDLYSFFYELGIKLMGEKGHLFYITSNSFLKAEYGRNLRTVILDNTIIKSVINIEDTQLFGGAIVNTVLLHLLKKSGEMHGKVVVVNKVFENEKEDFYSFIDSNNFISAQSNFSYNSWSLSKPEKENLKVKIETQGETLETLNTQIRLGIATGDNDVFLINENKRLELISEDNNNSQIIKPIIRGRDIGRYNYSFENSYILLTRNEIDVVKEYPSIYNYLNSFGEKFRNRGAKGKHWTNLRACSFFDDFKLEKIVWIELTDKPKFTLITEEIYLLNSAYFILPPKGIASKYLLTLLNSKTISFYLRMIANTSGMGTTRWINVYVKDFPIPVIHFNDQQPFIEKADIMLTKNNALQQLTKHFLQLLLSKYPALTTSPKLQAWYNLSFVDFVKELGKQKIELSLQEQSEWLQFFEQQKQNAIAIKNEIDKTDKEIDKMVYALYGLTADEIKIVEQG